MDEQSESKRGRRDGWLSEGIGESEIEELVSEWGWQRDKGSWFQRPGEA